MLVLAAAAVADDVDDIINDSSDDRLFYVTYQGSGADPKVTCFFCSV